jgi:hypothetical protein
MYCQLNSSTQGTNPLGEMMAKETIKIADTDKNENTIGDFLSDNYPHLDVDFGERDEEKRKVTVTIEGSDSLVKALKKALDR